MAKDTTKKENPLLSKNIPRPPSPTKHEEPTNVAENSITVEGQSAKPDERYTGIIATSQEEEKATVELSLYLKSSQDDKLEDLKRAYKRRAGKKISSNQIMRKLIDKATIDDLF